MRERQQDVEGRTRQVDPEIADRLRRVAGNAPRQGDQHGHARRRRDEVLHGQRQHLRQVAHRRFAAVALPVGVGGEADRGIERGVRRDRSQSLRVERQDALEPLQHIDRQEPQQVEDQQRRGIRLPGHLGIGFHRRGAIEEALDGRQHRVKEGPLAAVDARHEPAQRLDEQQQSDQVDNRLEPIQSTHPNFSGFSRATNR